MISFLRHWLPPLVWMALIFSASADTQSTEHTSRILGPLLRWLWPGIAQEKIELARWLVRKAAHVTEFAILAWLWWRAWRKPVRHDQRPWSWPAAWLALMGVILYAASDEFHQRFVANRTASVKDVCIDTVGGAAGLGLLWLLHQWRARRMAGRINNQASAGTSPCSSITTPP